MTQTRHLTRDVMMRFAFKALLIVACLNLIGVFVFFGARILRRGSSLPEVVIRHELSLNKPSQFTAKQELSGIMFQGDGVSVRMPLLNTTMTISQIYSFTPEIQRSAAKIFQMYTHESDILTLHPTILFRGGNIITLTELRFQQKRKSRMAPHDSVTYLFLRTYDRNFTVLDPGTLLQVDFPSTSTWTGAMSPYLFQSRDDIFLSFTARDEDSQRVFYTALDLEKFEMDPKSFGDVPPLDATDMAYIDTPVGATLTPVFAHGHINFMYSYDPLRCIQCSLVKGCSFVFKDGVSDVTDYGLLAGGSPLELYTWPYHVGVTNAKTVVKETKKTMYTSHLLVMALDSPRILYISEPLSIHDNVIRTVSLKDSMAADGYITVSGTILETSDSLSLAATINGVSNVMLRLTGLKRLLTDIIRTDLVTSPDMHRNPPPGTVQRNVMELIEEYLDTDIMAS